MRLVRVFEKALRTYGRTDRRTDGRTDRRTDRPSYRDARTHLKREKMRDFEFHRLQVNLLIVEWFFVFSGWCFFPPAAPLIRLTQVVDELSNEKLKVNVPTVDSQKKCIQWWNETLGIKGIPTGTHILIQMTSVCTPSCKCYAYLGSGKCWTAVYFIIL